MQTAKRVLDVGNCDPDHGNIRAMLTRNFDVSVDRVMHVHEALAAIADQSYDLVLVNRKIFADDSDGSELIRRLQRIEPAKRPPIMLLSNYSDAQAAAVADGAVPGFGKAALSAPETIAKLATFLKS